MRCAGVQALASFSGKIGLTMQYTNALIKVLKVWVSKRVTIRLGKDKTIGKLFKIR